MSDAFFGIAAADFNNDKNLDFVTTANLSNSLRYFSGHGDGTFGAPLTLGASSLSALDSLVSADFNGDGNLDLLLGSANVASVIFGNGDGTFRTAPAQIIDLAIPAPLSPSFSISPPLVGAADMNGDGNIDVVTADSFSNSVNVFLNDGTGKFPQPTPDFTAPLANGTADLRLTDLNGDGLPDIIVINHLTQDISIFLSIRPMTAPALAVMSTASQQLVGSLLTLTVKATGLTGQPPSGMVTLVDGMTSIAQQTLDATGQAAFSMSSLAAGQHSLSVNYTGDKNYLSARSTALADSVTDFQIAASVPSQTVSRGASATYSVNVTPIAGFTGNVTFTCSGLPATSTCPPTTVAVAGQPTTASINVMTTPATQLRTGLHSLSKAATAAASAAALCLFAFRRGRRTSLPQLAMLLFAAFGLGTFVGCSGANTGSSPSPPPTTGSPGSPSGTTAFTILASTTQGAQTVTHQLTAILVVN